MSQHTVDGAPCAVNSFVLLTVKGRYLGSVVYRDVPGFPGYRAGTDGSIWSCRRRGKITGNWKRLNPAPAGKVGFLKVNLCRNGVVVQKRVSHCVLETFVGPRPDGTEACHAPDPAQSNNALANLRWDTHYQNIQDIVQMGNLALGERCGSSVLTNEKVLEIRRLRREEGTPIKELARLFGVGRQAIDNVLARRTWAHV